MLNKYIWKLYLDAGGNETVQYFQDNLNRNMSAGYADFIRNLHQVYCADEEVIENTFLQLLDLQEHITNDTLADDGVEELAENIYIEAYESYSRPEVVTEKDRFLDFINSMEFMSTFFTIVQPDSFIPYYFFCNYNVLSMVADAFDIVLPEIPAKADYKGRIWHYFNLCKALHAFKNENGWSLYELCAFLYDFAPKYIGGKDSYIIKDIPEPKSAYFIGGGGKNGDKTAQDDPKHITRWQSNPDTRAGDMIVMYLTSPISAITSIWRSYSAGFYDPFFYYYRCTYLGGPIKIAPITLDRIKQDKQLGKMPIVAKNMQGINGIELKPSEYNRIIELSGKDIKKLAYTVVSVETECATEKEVEERLIKPLLTRLGYTPNMYVQQLSVPIGNHNRALIPDFVLHPKCSCGHYSAFAIVEAKRSITGDEQLEEIKVQARSYAKILGVRYSVIASQEKIWITSDKDDYSNEIFEASWSELKDNDIFYSLCKIVGF